MTKIGTGNFKTIQHAIRYYEKQGIDETEVARRIADKEIEIGAKSLRGKLFNWDSEGRAHYWQ